MGPTEFMLIIGGLASTISTLATALYRSERARRLKCEKQADQLTKIVVSQAAKKDETMAEFAKYLEARGYE